MYKEELGFPDFGLGSCEGLTLKRDRRLERVVRWVLRKMRVEIRRRECEDK